MQWSVSLGRYAGIELKVHLTFVLILTWVGFLQYRTGGPQAVVPGVLFVLALFTCVVLHEFGHALTARECLWNAAPGPVRWGEAMTLRLRP